MFTKSQISTFLRAQTQRLDAILEELGYSLHCRRMYSAEEAKAIMLRFYRWKGRAAGSGIEPEDGES